jgi:hypothetical protein
METPLSLIERHTIEIERDALPFARRQKSRRCGHAVGSG